MYMYAGNRPPMGGGGGVWVAKLPPITVKLSSRHSCFSTLGAGELECGCVVYGSSDCMLLNNVNIDVTDTSNQFS